MLDTTVRSDTNWINTSPVTSMAPVVRVRAGFNHKMTIPTADADGDDVRCRWAQSAKGECGSVCGVLPTGTLNSDCTLYFDASTAASGWYAASIALEDYQTTTSTTPMSTVILQFLIYCLVVTNPCTTP
jgi:hypothetical protein